MTNHHHTTRITTGSLPEAYAAQDNAGVECTHAGDAFQTPSQFSATISRCFAMKAAHPGVMLAMRVGDFYEFYGEDAEVAAGVLEVTLTGREDAVNGRVPMAGVPFHSVEKYLARLLQKGMKVALYDPSTPEDGSNSCLSADPEGAL